MELVGLSPWWPAPPGWGSATGDIDMPPSAQRAKPESWHPLEVAGIARRQRELSLDRGRGDERVGKADAAASSPHRLDPGLGDRDAPADPRAEDGGEDERRHHS